MRSVVVTGGKDAGMVSVVGRGAVSAVGGVIDKKRNFFSSIEDKHHLEKCVENCYHGLHMDTNVASPAVQGSAPLDLDALEKELAALQAEYKVLRDQTTSTINAGVARSDQRHIEDIKKKLGLAS